MADKKLIERNLKFNDKYTYLSIKRGNFIDGDCTFCDNCGKLIANVCNVVRHSDRKNFYIGTDCADTLSKAKCLYNNGSSSDFEVDMYSLGIVNRFVTQYNKTPELVECNGMSAEIIITEMKDGKVKTKEYRAWLKDLQQFAPDTYRNIQTDYHYEKMDNL